MCRVSSAEATTRVKNVLTVSHGRDEDNSLVREYTKRLQSTFLLREAEMSEYGPIWTLLKASLSRVGSKPGGHTREIGPDFLLEENKSEYTRGSVDLLSPFERPRESEHILVPSPSRIEPMHLTRPFQA